MVPKRIPFRPLARGLGTEILKTLPSICLSKTSGQGSKRGPSSAPLPKRLFRPVRECGQNGIRNWDPFLTYIRSHPRDPDSRAPASHIIIGNEIQKAQKRGPKTKTQTKLKYLSGRGEGRTRRLSVETAHEWTP